MFKPIFASRSIYLLILMMIAAAVFGMMTLDLFRKLDTNIMRITADSMMQFEKKAVHELLVLLVQGFIAICSYVVIKACEKELVERMQK